MVTVLPFKALRPQKQYVEKVAAHPYDVLEWEEAKKIGDVNPTSFLHVEKPEIDFPRETAMDPGIHVRAKKNLELLIKDEILIREDKPKFYVYRLKQRQHIQYGLVACLSIPEYEAGQIKRHELTTVDKEQDRIRNIDTVNANTGLVFCVYSARESINRIVEESSRKKAEYDFTFDDGVTHTVWVVSDQTRIEAIKNAFLEVDAVYIADGHHRAASAAAVARIRREKRPVEKGTQEYNFFMAGLFPHDQVKIMEYNRIVKDLNGLSEEQFLHKLRDNFSVSENPIRKSPPIPHQFGMYLCGRWFRLETQIDNRLQKDLVGKLDVSLLQERVLSSILGIDDPRKDKRIRFVGGIRGIQELEKMVDSKEFAVAFSLFPPSVTELMAVADSGQIMPPKSTWFEPKLLSGLFVHPLE